MEVISMSLRVLKLLEGCRVQLAYHYAGVVFQHNGCDKNTCLKLLSFVD
jgi:hypothetical protein